MKEGEAPRLNRLDKAGIACSGACALHCMAAPIIAFFAPTLTAHFENEWLHILLLLLILPIAGTAFYGHRRLHGHTAPLAFGVAGGVLLVGAVLSEKVPGMEIEGLELILTVLGSASLITGHILNMWCVRRNATL